jgi:signal transduction histidine kinase
MRANACAVQPRRGSFVLSEQTHLAAQPLRPSRVGIIVFYLVYVAVIVRALGTIGIRNLWPEYLGLFSAHLVLFTVLLLRPGLPRALLHPYLIVQSAIILRLISLFPRFDFVVVLFLPLCYQATLWFTGSTRWAWIGVLNLLIAGSLIPYYGVLQGLALSLITMAAGVIFSAYVIVNHEIETARAQSQALLGELQETHQQLESYAGQVEELAAMQERNRLARELHDSVSQTMFSIILNIRSTQILLEREPARVRPQLEQLQELSSRALSQMRALISQWRPG